MLSPKLEEALNRQLNKEIFSSYLYYSMAAYLASGPLSGMAKWMFVQAQEEMTHAMRFYNYILERGARVKLAQIEAPQMEWKDPVELFENALSHEEMITASINEIASLAIKENDHSTSIYLQWFITEQVEEEDSVKKVIDKLKLVGTSSQGLYMVDREMSARVFNIIDPQAISMTAAE